MEIANVFIHADSLLSLTGLHKLFLDLLISLLVFKFKGEFQVNISYFMLSMQVCHLEGLFKLSLIRLILNYGVN